MRVENKKSYNALKIESGTGFDVEDWIVTEAPLQISINGKPYTVTMRTPGNDKYLIRGLFYTENIYQGSKPLRISINEDKSIADILIESDKLHAGYLKNRSLISVSSCGICGKRSLEDVKVIGNKLESKEKLDLRFVKPMFETMNRYQHTFLQTGGAHASACFTIDGKLLAVQEDIGRHNAVDKVIGKLVEENLLQKVSCLIVSGRISYEIVTKCFMAEIPFLAAVSSPSSMSIESATSMGITLLAFCRGEHATCYSHPGRIKNVSVERVHS